MHWTFCGVNHILDHKACLDNFKNTEIRSSTSAFDDLEVDISNRRKFRKFTSKLNNMLLKINISMNKFIGKI